MKKPKNTQRNTHTSRAHTPQVYKSTHTDLMNNTRMTKTNCRRSWKVHTCTRTPINTIYGSGTERTKCSEWKRKRWRDLRAIENRYLFTREMKKWREGEREKYKIGIFCGEWKREKRLDFFFVLNFFTLKTTLRCLFWPGKHVNDNHSWVVWVIRMLFIIFIIIIMKIACILKWNNVQWWFEHQVKKTNTHRQPNRKTSLYP